MARRLKAHRTGKGGAKYTKSHGGPAVRLAYAERCADKSAALKREAAIKKLPKAEKEALAAKWAADNCITIRMATPADGAAVAELYNWYVLHRHPDFPVPAFHGRGVRRQHCGCAGKSTVSGGHHPGRPACRGLPAPTPGTAARPMPGMWRLPFIVAPDCVGQGLGKRLYTALLELLRMQGYYNAFAIVTGENKASHEFHERMGFTKSFVEKHSGYKFGRWLDVVYWQYPLRTGDAPPEPVRYRLTEARWFQFWEKLICNKANRHSAFSV